jgi:23S rRNA (uracil1939-C5)-methyltransferase
VSELCRHFGVCGGCAYQDLPDDDYRKLKRSIVVDALAKHGLSDFEVAELVEVPPGTRRRASFKIAKVADSTRVGFHAAASHDIVDMHECRILTPSLFAFVADLRSLMHAMLADAEKAEAFVVEAANGIDVAIRWKRKMSPQTISEIARWARPLSLARVSVNGETNYVDEAPYVNLGPARVVLPVEGFLQPTEEGQKILQVFVIDAAKGAKSAADLFSGCGTFALSLARSARVHAVESDASALSALAAGARMASGLKPVTTERRDLFRQPLTPPELERHDVVVLDPPRVGAIAQVREMAKSKLRRIAYVSCNAETFARDAKLLVEAGFRPGSVIPVDQFLWSSHIELAATFTRA